MGRCVHHREPNAWRRKTTAERPIGHGRARGGSALTAWAAGADAWVVDRAAWVVLGGLVAALGCGGKDERTPLVSSDGGISFTAGDGGGSDSGSGSAGETSASAGEGVERLDLPPATDTESLDPDADRGCQKVDLLFVVDSSGSMADEQINLVNAFPGFIEAMRTTLADTDGYHIGVVTTDAYPFDTTCAPLNFGNLVVQTGGESSSNATCSPFSSGGRFMTEADDLDTKFACAARVGTSGDGDERPMQALLAALTPPIAGDGGCNEGFLRDDALLVVVIITDEEDDHETPASACAQLPQQGSNGEPQEWYDSLVAVKGGVESNIVVLSLVGPDEQSGRVCPALDKCGGGIIGAEQATRILEFTRKFTYGFIGPVCEDYGLVFAESIGVIESACEGFMPIG